MFAFAHTSCALRFGSPADVDLVCYVVCFSECIMKKSLSIYCVFIAIALTGGCTLETLDTYDGPQCENVEKIITIIDYGRPNGIYNEVSCLSHVTDVNTNRVICDEYVSYDHVNGVSIAQTEPQMIYALSSGHCPESYVCKGGAVCILATCDGLYTNFDSDNMNCGSCGNICRNNTSCIDGKCSIADKSKVLCSGEYINPENDPRYCGAKGACSDADISSNDYRGTRCDDLRPLCANGRCVSTCIGNQILCDGKCIDPNVNNAYCGAKGLCNSELKDDEDYKGMACPSGEVCSEGTCDITCVAGQILCDGKCIDPNVNNAYCGAKGLCNSESKDDEDYKGMACPSGNVCSEGKCGITCVAGQIKCGNKCIDPLTNNTYCGAKGLCNSESKDDEDYKGMACPSGNVCSEGKCGITCVAGQIKCGNKCIDPLTNNTYCGATGDCTGYNSGVSCPSGNVCSGGSCHIACPGMQVLCNNICVNPSTDDVYCGARGRCNSDSIDSPDFGGVACKNGYSCKNGRCNISCLDSQVICNGKCIDPETNDQYCGAKGQCNNASSTSNDYKGVTCGDGMKCIEGNCHCASSNHIMCGGKCIDPNTDNQYCGAKGYCISTDSTNANYNGANCKDGNICVAGKCILNTCPSGYTLCDSNGSRSCVNVNADDIYNCGACGYSCVDNYMSGVELVGCHLGECRYRCPDGYTNDGSGDTVSTIQCI